VKRPNKLEAVVPMLNWELEFPRTAVLMPMVMRALTDLALWALEAKPMAKQVKKPEKVTTPRLYLPMLKTKQ
jgi:hypothetical protein